MPAETRFSDDELRSLVRARSTFLGTSSPLSLPQRAKAGYIHLDFKKLRESVRAPIRRNLPKLVECQGPVNLTPIGYTMHPKIPTPEIPLPDPIPSPPPLQSSVPTRPLDLAIPAQQGYPDPLPGFNQQGGQHGQWSGPPIAYTPMEYSYTVPSHSGDSNPNCYYPHYPNYQNYPSYPTYPNYPTFQTPAFPTGEYYYQTTQQVVQPSSSTARPLLVGPPPSPASSVEGVQGSSRDPPSDIDREAETPPAPTPSSSQVVTPVSQSIPAQLPEAPSRKRKFPALGERLKVSNYPSSSKGLTFKEKLKRLPLRSRRARACAPCPPLPTRVESPSTLPSLPPSPTPSAHTGDELN